MSTLYEVPDKGGDRRLEGLGIAAQADSRPWFRVGIIAGSAAYQFAT